MEQIREHAKTLKGALDSGVDPTTIELNEVGASVRAKCQGNSDWTFCSLTKLFYKLKVALRAADHQLISFRHGSQIWWRLHQVFP
jgi:hypothetical protein